VDPSFASEIHRLLSTHPECFNLLNAHNCYVTVGSERNALDILHSLRMHAPEVFSQLEDEINREVNWEDKSMRVASMLLEHANSNWDDLNKDEQYTVLALPIHRQPDGKFIPLLPAREETADRIVSDYRLQDDYRLQCDDDIEDAPVTLPTGTLLQTRNPAAR